METWLAQTEENHRDHMNNLGFRACLEKAATDLNIKLIKNKRRILAANVNESISTKPVLSADLIKRTDINGLSSSTIRLHLLYKSC